MRGVRNAKRGVTPVDDETWVTNLPPKYHKPNRGGLNWANFAQQKRNDAEESDSDSDSDSD